MEQIPVQVPSHSLTRVVKWCLTGFNEGEFVEFFFFLLRSDVNHVV